MDFLKTTGSDVNLVGIYCRKSEDGSQKFPWKIHLSLEIGLC